MTRSQWKKENIILKNREKFQCQTGLLKEKNKCYEKYNIFKNDQGIFLVNTIIRKSCKNINIIDRPAWGRIEWFCESGRAQVG